MMSRPILKLVNLTKKFGGLVAVNDVDLELESGKLHAIIGPNGAGKTTFFNVISGFYAPSAGQIIFDGMDITKKASHQIARLGMARTLQVKSVFGSMTVAENVWIAAHPRGSVFNPFRPASSFTKTKEKTEQVLEATGLSEMANLVAGTLSYGDMALLEIGIALATEPKLLLLDEPVCGMSPAETEQTVGRIKKLSETVDIVIIEHDMEFVFGLADDITVMAQGGILAKGSPKEITENAEVREAYLGEEDDEDWHHA